VADGGRRWGTKWDLNMAPNWIPFDFESSHLTTGTLRLCVYRRFEHRALLMSRDHDVSTRMRSCSAASSCAGIRLTMCSVPV
jgi:hypothetical protein